MEKERATSAAAAAAAAEEFEYDDEEEKKMDKFYELIRRFNEARNHHQFRHQNQTQLNHNNNNNNNNNNNQTKNKSDVNLNYNYKGSATDTRTTWMPSFKWEDFRQVLSHQNQQESDRDQQLLVSSEKSAIDFLQPHPEISKFDDYNINNLKKKRKMDDVNDDDDGEITTADHNKHSSPRLDLNLAL